jgi:hypothetical protein
VNRGTIAVAGRALPKFDADCEVGKSAPVPADHELERRLLGVETNTVGTTKVLRELVHRMELLTVAVRTPGSVQQSDFDEMLEALAELDALLTRISEFLPDVGD